MAAQKNSFSALERDEEERARWRKLVRRLDANRLLFVDECATHTSMARTRARAPKGKRAYGQVPRNRGKNTTLLASLSLRGMGQAIAFEGAINKEIFEAYVERFLAPALGPDQVVVLDNLSTHKGKRVRDLVEARGASLLFLPTYSPDFSPIEEAFSKTKALLKKAAAPTRQELVEAIGKALGAVTPEDAKGWFIHCGYEAAAYR